MVTRSYLSMNYLEDENSLHTVPAIYAISQIYYLRYPRMFCNRYYLSTNMSICDSIIEYICREMTSYLGRKSI